MFRRLLWSLSDAPAAFLGNLQRQAPDRWVKTDNAQKELTPIHVPFTRRQRTPTETPGERGSITWFFGRAVENVAQRLYKALVVNTSGVLKGLTHLGKSRSIYPKYMPKCSVGSTDYVCNFCPKIFRNVKDIDVWNFRQKRFMWRHLGLK